MSAQPHNGQQPVGAVTYDEVRQAYADYYTANGATTADINATDAILHLVSTTGELASYAGSAAGQHNTATVTEFEKQEIADVIGSLAVSLSIISEAFGVDAGEAALARIDRLQRRSNGRPVAATKPPQPQQRATQPATAQRGQRGLNIDTQAPIDPNNGPPNGEDAPLSPNTANNFFPMLDALRDTPAHEIEQIGITWCVPGPGGKMISLDGPDGRDRVVTADRWQEFLEKVAPFRPGGPSLAHGDVSVSARTTPGAAPLYMGVPQHAHQQPQRHQPVQHVEQPYIVPPASTGIPPIGVGASQQGEAVLRRVTVNQPQGHNNNDGNLFSPSHFSRDLFSPHTEATSFDIPYHVAGLSPTSREEIYASTSTPQHEPNGRPQVANGATSGVEAPLVQLPAAIHQKHEQHKQQTTTNNADLSQEIANLPPALRRQVQLQHQQQQQQQQAAAHPPLTQAQQGTPTQNAPGAAQATPPSATRTGTQIDDAEVMFWDRFAQIESGDAQGPQINQLGLFFVMPHNGNWLELTNNGGSVPVTATNASTFVTLLKEKQRDLHGRFRRSHSMKTLAIQNIATYDAAAVNALYSPRHDEHGLFAPHTNETTFNVDESQAQETLPAFIRTTMTQGFSNPSQYVEHISGKQTNFLAILQEIRQRPEAVRKFKVTYCIPSDDGKVTDLVQDGRHKMVNPGDVPTFLGYVEKYFPQ